MDLKSLRQRLARIGVASAPAAGPNLKIRLAGAIPGVHRCGPALVTVVSPEERRPELERQRAENERITGRPARDTLDLDETLAMETREAERVAANPAASGRILARVLGMNSEARTRMLAELNAKITAANGGTKQWT